MHEFAESKTRPKRGELSLLYSISTPYNINCLGQMPFFQIEAIHSQAPYIIRTLSLYQRTFMIARVWSLLVRWVLEPKCLSFSVKMLEFLYENAFEFFPKTLEFEGLVWSLMKKVLCLVGNLFKVYQIWQSFAAHHAKMNDFAIFTAKSSCDCE